MESSEKYLELMEKAEEHLKKAERSMRFTYKLVNEPKLLLTSINSIFLACTNITGSLLYYELRCKNIDVFDDNFESKFQLMRKTIADKHNIDHTYLKMMRELKQIIIAHKESSIEFTRGKSYLICNDNYQFKQLNDERVDNYIKKTKEYIDEIKQIIDNDKKRKK